MRATWKDAARHFWREYKVAAQFSKPWSDVEDAMYAAHRLANKSPPVEAVDALRAPPARGSWRQMERVHIEPWFFHEIGRLGDNPSIWVTQATLTADNARRRKEYEATERALAQAAKASKKQLQG